MEQARRCFVRFKRRKETSDVRLPIYFLKRRLSSRTRDDNLIDFISTDHTERNGTRGPHFGS